MKKLVFREFYKELSLFLLTFLFLMGVIVWTIQAVNYFDFVTQDGHGLNVYFVYSFLNFPKIISRILPVILFISIFYTLINYELRNEMFLFWVNGITKTQFMNKILFFSIIVMIIQLFITGYLSPFFQHKARENLKNSNIDFFTSLIKEGKFINITKGLTIFMDKKENDGTYTKIFIEENNEIKSRMIYANRGELLENQQTKILKLLNGRILNIDKNRINIFDFKEINFNLSNLTSKTIITPKLQEINSWSLMNCLVNPKKNNLEVFRCEKKIEKEVIQELLKRFYKPLYIPLIALLCCFLLSTSKNDVKFRLKIYTLFFLIFLILILSEILIAYSIDLKYFLIILLLIPFSIFVFCYLLFFRIFKNV